LGFQEAEAPEFLKNRLMKVPRLSALRTGRLYPDEGFLVLISVKRLRTGAVVCLIGLTKFTLDLFTFHECKTFGYRRSK
jgi:hypothetical protein